jgi:putative ATP-binding cassette transporter
MHGEILVNGQLISVPVSSDYRNIFSAVFSDFFLFKKLYGIQNPDPATIRELISTFRMEGKVDIVNGVFSDLNFSTGQRKRIALIVALLEQKQIMILDEWAADQDPEFRQEFYEHIIPRLRAMGKTVIAITHDDHYYNVADHVLYLTDGKLSK